MLQLTNESIAGIVLALIVMNFMLKASDIFTGIFSMVGDKDGGSRSLGTILASDPKSEIYEKLFVAKAAGNMVKGFAAGAVEFGKDLKSSLATGTDRKKQVQAQALGIGNLGKKALGQSWAGIKNIDAATGQYVPKGKAEKLSSLSADLTNAEKQSKEKKKKERNKFLSDLQSTHNNRMTNALKLATAFPLMGVSGYAGIGASNLVTASVDTIANSVSKRNLKNKRNSKMHKFTAPIRMAGTIAGGPVLAGARGIKDSIKDGMETGGKIQDSYESRMTKIGQAKDAESKIIDLYKSGRRNKEDEIRSTTGRDDKVVRAMAKTSFNDSYRRTVDNVFEVSDLVDKTVDADNSLRGYKAGLGFDERTIGKRSIEDVKEKVQQKARDNIAEKIREQYQTGANNNLDASTERRIQQETDARVSMFMRDLEREIDDKTDKHAELANDPTILKGDKLDYSETINSDTLKSTIEDMMKLHGVDKKVDDGMEELRDEMQKLQRIDREYANSKANKEKTYLYKFGTDVKSADESRTNLKNVLSSLTFRNIDINGGRR